MSKKKNITRGNKAEKPYLVNTPPSPDVFDNQFEIILEVTHHELVLLINNRDYYLQEALKIKQSPERKNAMHTLAILYDDRIRYVKQCLCNLSRY